MDSPEVIVVGGGIAGIAAALEVNKAGRRVLLIERSRFLGGRAGSSFLESEGELDAGHHVYLGCCTNLRQLLGELGVERLAPLEKRLDLAIIDAALGSRRRARLRAVPLPYPLSLAGALLRYGHLSPLDRLRAIGTVARAVRERRTADRAGRLERATFLQWLEESGASKEAIRCLWEPLAVAALNAPPAAVSASAGVMLLAESLAGGAKAASIGLFRAPMSRLWEPAVRLLEPAGGALLGRPVRRVIIEDGRAKGVALDLGEEIAAGAVIVATSHVHAVRLLPDAAASHPFFARLTRLATRPIVNVHLWYDRPVMDEVMTGVLGSPLQWIFDLSALYEKAPGDNPGRLGRHYSVSISDARREMEIPQAQLVEEIDREVRRIFPAAGQARLVRGLARKVRHATFTCEPGSAILRPTNETPVPGLFLAGDYTDTGWPATMESAVIGGKTAARLALGYLSRR